MIKCVPFASGPGGVDWAKSEPLKSDGHLWKLTLAPQLSRGGKFFSRPVIRPFITYAKWSDGFKGRVGGSAYRFRDRLAGGTRSTRYWVEEVRYDGSSLLHGPARASG